MGLAIKGITPPEIERGDIICSGETIKIATTEVLVTDFSKNKYFNSDITESQTYLLSVGLQIKPVKILNDGSKIILSLEKPIAYYKQQRFLILKPDSKTTRIIVIIIFLNYLLKLNYNLINRYHHSNILINLIQFN